MLYKLLEVNPDWFHNALYHGWIHPVTKSCIIHDDVPSDHIDLDLNADYRLRFTPYNDAGQEIDLHWDNSPPSKQSGKRITNFTFAVIDNIPQMSFTMGSYNVRARVETRDGSSLQLPVYWRVNESHEGLWKACRPRTVAGNHVGDVKPILY